LEYPNPARWLCSALGLPVQSQGAVARRERPNGIGSLEHETAAIVPSFWSMAGPEHGGQGMSWRAGCGNRQVEIEDFSTGPIATRAELVSN
jgi:hypothetical protein